MKIHRIVVGFVVALSLLSTGGVASQSAGTRPADNELAMREETLVNRPMRATVESSGTSSGIINMFAKVDAAVEKPAPIVFTNGTGNDVLITDIDLTCGACNLLRINAETPRYVIQLSRNESQNAIVFNRSFTTGILWPAGEGLEVFFTDGSEFFPGLLMISISGIVLSETS